MAVQVYQPNAQNKGREDMMAILPVAGTIAGAMIGGPAGAAAGGAVGGQLAKDQQTPAGPQPIQSPTPQTNSDSMSGMNAVQRRQQALQDAKQMDNALQVANQDPQLKQQYAPMLYDARQNALQRYQNGGGGSYT